MASQNGRIFFFISRYCTVKRRILFWEEGVKEIKFVNVCLCVCNNQWCTVSWGKGDSRMEISLCICDCESSFLCVNNRTKLSRHNAAKIENARTTCPISFICFFLWRVLLYHLPEDSTRKDAEVASLVGRKPRLVVRAQCTVPSMAAAQWIISVRQPGEQKASWMKSQPQNYHRRFNGVSEL